MLNRQLPSSSKKKKKSSPSPATLKVDPTKKKQSPRTRSPLKDLNSFSRNNSGSNSSVSIEAPRGCLRFFLSNSSSSRTPIHALRSLTKAPKSAANARPSHPSSFQSRPSKQNQPKASSHSSKRNHSCLHQWQSGKKLSSRTALKSKPSSDLGASRHDAASETVECSRNQEQFQQQNMVRMFCSAGGPAEPSQSPAIVENCTPTAEVARVPALNCAFGKLSEENSNPTVTPTTATPPVEASVSPEIQHQLSVLVSATATPACYGAGHIVSGVMDKRKCRPRGILKVGDNDLGCSSANVFDVFFDDDDDVMSLSNSRLSLVPLPAEASMRWLLSPCDEEAEQCKCGSANGSWQHRKLLGSATPHFSSSPPSLSNGFPSRVCSNNYSGISNSNTSTSCGGRSRIALLSPSGLPELKGVLELSSPEMVGCSSSPSFPVTTSSRAVISQEERKYQGSLENSPFSTENLGSANVIRTPQSGSSSDKHVGLSRLNVNYSQNCYFEDELDMMEEILQGASLSPKNQILSWDLPGLPFTDLTSPSDSIDFAQIQKTLDDHAACISVSTLEDVSQSNIRISWRDGLMSRIFEMDEFDCCRCLSDDENDTNECKNDELNSNPSSDLSVDVGNCQILSKSLVSSELVSHRPSIDENGKENFAVKRPNSSVESICTDGCDLVASGDSDWTLCYKNQLFKL